MLMKIKKSPSRHRYLISLCGERIDDRLANMRFLFSLKETVFCMSSYKRTMINNQSTKVLSVEFCSTFCFQSKTKTQIFYRIEQITILIRFTIMVRSLTTSILKLTVGHNYRRRKLLLRHFISYSRSIHLY